MLQNYPDTFTLVQYHVGDAYAVTWCYTRATFYGVTGTPDAWFDGALNRPGAYATVPQQYNYYLGAYNTRMGVPTDVTINLSAVQISSNTFEMTAHVCVEAGGAGKTMRIYMVQVLDHWPADLGYHRNGFKQAATTQDITVAAGECGDVVRTFTLDAGSMAANQDVKIIAWAQVPNGSAPADVYQTAVKGWPLVRNPGDVDGNGVVNNADYAVFADCMAGPALDPEPTSPWTVDDCLAVFDFDDDGDVDLIDYGGLQGVMTIDRVWYVDAAATGANNGKSWTSAFTDLQDALATADAGDQIWIAAGTYAPAGSGGSRTATFTLVNGVDIHGGFDGTENSLADRDLAANETVLTGDLNSNDQPGFVNISDNAYHVVTSSYVSEGTIVEGVTIAGGNANGTGDNDRGSAIFNAGGSPTFINCRVRGNKASGNGGGMHNRDGGSPTFVNTVFSGNQAGNNGGAIQSYLGNTVTLANCTLSENTATASGGGIFGNQTDHVVANCVLWGNTDSGGTDETAQLHFSGGVYAISYSCMQGWTGGAYAGTAVSGSNPLLVDADGADNVAGTADDDLHLSAGSPCIDSADNTAVPADESDLNDNANTTEPLPIDIEGNARFTDDPSTADSGVGTPPIVDRGAYEFQP